jgi:hypothetical protein
MPAPGHGGGGGHDTEWHQIVPSAAVLAHDLERQLREIATAVVLLISELKQHQQGSTTRNDAVTIALEHVEAAIDALELASRE